MGSAELPETIDENEIINTALETLGVVASHWLAANGVAPCKAYEPIQKAEPETNKEK